MKKLILFVVVVLVMVFQSYGALNLMTWDGSKNTDFNDTANWTGNCAAGTTLSAGDSCLMNAGAVAATASANISIGNLFTTSGYSGNLSWSTKTLTTVNGVNLSHTGTTNLGTGITMSGNGALVFGAGIGVVTGGSCAVTCNGVDTLTNNLGVTMLS